MRLERLDHTLWRYLEQDNVSAGAPRALRALKWTNSVPVTVAEMVEIDAYLAGFGGLNGDAFAVVRAGTDGA